MEDINVKRDARRRRILENSQKRLSKITGRIPNEESEDTFSGDIKSGVVLEAHVNGIISDKCNDRINDVNGFTLDDTWNGALNARYKQNDVKSEMKDTNFPSTQKKTSPFVLLTSGLNYVLLAIIVNILLLLQLDYLFGKTIAMPYLLILLGRLYTCMNIQETQNDTLFYAALTLCNIKPEVTYQFKKLVSVLRMILKDLILYIFSFTIVHYGLFYWLYNINVPSDWNA